MNTVTRYFAEEKKESVLFVLIGFVACTLALYFLLVIKKPFFTGFSYALIALGLVQLVVGASIYYRCDLDTVRVNHYIERERKSIADYEIPRMQTVMKNFIIYRWAEIFLILTGLLLSRIMDKDSLFSGLGSGLAVQSSVLLILDYFAEKRGSAYLQYISGLAFSNKTQI